MDIGERLADILSEFARTLGTDFPIEAILDHLVVRIVDVLPIAGAGVTLISPGVQPQLVAASDETAMRLELLQSELGEGPCIAAYETDRAVSVADLVTDDRFPAFSARAAEAGLAAVFTFPLRQGDHLLGALDLYRFTPGPLDEAAMGTAQTLADVAAAYLVNARARADLEASSELARHTSLHDDLTGLPNRTLLVQHLDAAILRCHRSERMVAILFVDLDRFKLVNDAFGHHVGDQLLAAVAGRLATSIRPGDMLARLSGDEFVVLCEEIDDMAEAEPLALRIEMALGKAFDLADGEVAVSASIGIAFAGRSDDDSERVLQDADAAMYQVKRGGGNGHRTVDRSEQRRAHRRAGLNRDLRTAVTRGELHLEYQPILAVPDVRLVAVEALLRWVHPIQGRVDPHTAIPIAEQSGRISEIGQWVLEQACRDLRRWHRVQRREDLQLAVNVSPEHLLLPDFAASVALVLSDAGLQPSLVSLEITEAGLVGIGDRAVLALDELKAVGVRLALDDFGVADSSIGHLRRFPLDVVKIDGALIGGLDDAEDRLVVDAIVGLAHGLGMAVAAEAVESEAQRGHVARLGFDLCQGYHFAAPMPSGEFEARLRDDGFRWSGGAPTGHRGTQTGPGSAGAAVDVPAAHPEDASPRVGPPSDPGPVLQP